MAKSFTKAKPLDKKSEVGEKLAELALDIMDDLLHPQKPISIDTKLTGLKIMTSYYAIEQKLAPPEDPGDAFAKYRQKLSAGNSGGAGNSRSAESDSSGSRTDAKVVPLKYPSGDVLSEFGISLPEPDEDESGTNGDEAELLDAEHEDRDEEAE